MLKSLNDKIIAFLLACTVSLTGLAYAGVTTRLDTLEEGKRDLDSIVRAVEIQTAVVAVQAKTIAENSKATIARLDSLDARQQETLVKMNELLIQFNQNTREYQLAMARWLAALEKQGRTTNGR